MFIADFHIHSKYSRATSRDCVPEMLDLWARRKGLGLIGTGDFTHPAWREELSEKLEPAEEGLYMLKDQYRLPAELAGRQDRPRFIVSGEISSIYKKNGRVRKVHNLIILPGIAQAEALAHRLETIGNLHSDGRPILGLDSRDLAEITFDICPRAIFIPAHIWTPHFSVFGAYSGFDDFEECYEDMSGYIHAVETGLSSDPPMNWRLSALDRFVLVSDSDAHSPKNLAREANIFDTEMSYSHISRALQDHDTREFYGTIEFFPEEGKYHCDGHRKCDVCFSPGETRAASGICPVCGKKLTVGVLHRVEDLADRPEGFIPPSARHFESLVPLPEVIGAAAGVGSASVRVQRKYDELLHLIGPEFFILREAPLEDIRQKAGSVITEAIRRLRSGDVRRDPGYDGRYGKIEILDEQETGQLCFLEPVKKEKTPDLRKRSRDDKDSDAPAAGPSVPEKNQAAAETAEAAEALPYGCNPRQWEAVSSSGDHIMVSAGPGTGKTKTLVSRICYLLDECGVRPSQITAVTFTNKAAEEMRQRLEKQPAGKAKVKAMNIGTFHSICLRILSSRRNAGKITVIDETNAMDIIEGILKKFETDISPRETLRKISLVKNGALDLQTSDIPPEVYDLYNESLRQYDVLDYDDILLNVLADKDDQGTAKTDCFSYILADEFQDINDIQYQLIKKWSAGSRSVFVIGDPDQSVYGFRGSDPGCFDQFREEFSPEVVRLTENYRSTPEILDCAASLISKGNPDRLGCALEAKKAKGTKTRLLSAADTFSEAVSAAKEINALVGGIDMLDAVSRTSENVSGGRYAFSDIAILYRTNRQGEILEKCLAKEGIPYTVAGRERFLSDPDVKKTVAFFRFLLEPDDMVSLKICLENLGFLKGGALHGFMADYAAGPAGPETFRKLLKKYQPPDNLPVLFEKYRHLVRRKKPQDLIEAFMKDLAISGEPAERLLNMAVMHDRTEAFLQTLVMGGERDVVRNGSRSYSPDTVSLMTLHAAKGLEFPAVFLCGLNEGTVPYESRLRSGDPDEERRLLYVGITRARDELFMLTSGVPSPFLEDIPEDLLLKKKVFSCKRNSDIYQISFFDKS